MTQPPAASHNCYLLCFTQVWNRRSNCSNSRLESYRTSSNFCGWPLSAASRQLHREQNQSLFCKQELQTCELERIEWHADQSIEILLRMPQALKQCHLLWRSGVNRHQIWGCLGYMRLLSCVRSKQEQPRSCERIRPAIFEVCSKKLKQNVDTPAHSVEEKKVYMERLWRPIMLLSIEAKRTKRLAIRKINQCEMRLRSEAVRFH